MTLSQSLSSLLSLLQLSLCFHIAVAAAEFNPYQLNGGLVSAVAGRDYVVIATDTRMIGESGYEILQRHHLSSRLWSVTDVAFAKNTDRRSRSRLLTVDGSIVATDHDPPSGDSSALTRQSRHSLAVPPVLVGSSGCSADCERLKRVLRADWRAAQQWSETTCMDGSAPQVAWLLSQVLYGKRSFPYYSFCVVAGLSQSQSQSCGQVWVYDAIGSYEPVAVVCSGSGRELLQPILDAKFRSAQRQNNEDDDQHQKWGNLPHLYVDCSKDDAVSILLEGYRAASEREISVGDGVVFCVIQKHEDGNFECEVLSAPLKRH